MGRMILGAIVGFFAWNTIWLGSEKGLSAISPKWFGVHQVAFEAAVTKGGDFKPDKTILLMNIVRAGFVSVMAGFLAAAIAGENRRAPRILAGLLVALCLLMAAMSYQIVPLWYYLGFLAVLVPTTILGGRLRKKPTLPDHSPAALEES